jgi:hypothetical protein
MKRQYKYLVVLYRPSLFVFGYNVHGYVYAESKKAVRNMIAQWDEKARVQVIARVNLSDPETVGFHRVTIVEGKTA